MSRWIFIFMAMSRSVDHFFMLSSNSVMIWGILNNQVASWGVRYQMPYRLSTAPYTLVFSSYSPSSPLPRGCSLPCGGIVWVVYLLGFVCFGRSCLGFCRIIFGFIWTFCCPFYFGMIHCTFLVCKRVLKVSAWVDLRFLMVFGFLHFDVIGWFVQLSAHSLVFRRQSSCILIRSLFLFSKRQVWTLSSFWV